MEQGLPEREDWSRDRAEAILAGHSGMVGATLPILHEMQRVFGYIPDDAIQMIAETLNLSRAEVYGIVTFYHDFRRHPPGRHALMLCRAEACQSMGGERLAAHARTSLGVDWHATTADGGVTMEPGFCLGLCATAPAALLDGVPLGRLDAGRLDAALQGVRTPSTPESVMTPSPPRSAPRSATKIFVPRDAAALAVGAEAVASALAQTPGVELVRNGSRGLFWLEPMVEVATDAGRIAYGPVSAADVPGLLAAGLLEGGAHALRLGRAEDIPFLARQTRLTFARCGIVDPLSFADYAAHDGLRGLRRALSLSADEIIADVTQSGLRGRGGAGFPAGVKWRTVADAPGIGKYVVCNADEGDSGTYADRMLLEGDPFVLIEGMAIAAIAVGARQGYVYIRSEYPHAIASFTQALAIARDNGLLGPSVLGTGPAFDIEIRAGAGAYICGEETAMLESIEGKRGMVRAKPPLPAHVGLFGCPTVINNLVTLASVPVILDRGGAFYRDFGMGRSRGTIPIQLAGNLARTGLFEAGFGVTLGELVEEIGGGTATGRPIRAVQVGGPLGAYFPPSLFDTPFDYEAFAARDGLIGHGGVVVFDDSVDLAHQARFAMEFCATESCGKCTPCRIGSTRGVEVIDRILAGDRREGNLALLQDLCETMKLGSLCALGGLTHTPVLSALKHFPEDFSKPARLAAE